MKEVQIIKDLDCVENKLSELGLTITQLQEAAQANFLAQAFCNRFDANTAPGFKGWNETVKKLSEALDSVGWKRFDHKNSPRLIDPEERFEIMFATGDSATGIPVLTPKTKSNKGSTTRSSVKENIVQGMLFDEDSLPHVIPLKPIDKPVNNGKPTWVLLTYVEIDRNSENPQHIVRCELSLPVGMNDAGYVTQWSERIIVPEIDNTINKKRNKTEFAPEQEIVIKRK